MEKFVSETLGICFSMKRTIKRDFLDRSQVFPFTLFTQGKKKVLAPNYIPTHN